MFFHPGFSHPPSILFLSRSCVHLLLLLLLLLDQGKTKGRRSATFLRFLVVFPIGGAYVFRYLEYLRIHRRFFFFRGAVSISSLATETRPSVAVCVLPRLLVFFAIGGANVFRYFSDLRIHFRSFSFEGMLRPLPGFDGDAPPPARPESYQFFALREGRVWIC